MMTLGLKNGQGEVASDRIAAHFSAAELSRILNSRGAEGFEKEVRRAFEKTLHRLEPSVSEEKAAEAANNVTLAELSYGLLKNLLDERDGWRRWKSDSEEDLEASEVLSESKRSALPGFDRESAILWLWETLAQSCEGRKYVKETLLGSLAFHRHQIYEWLLSRYRLAEARAVWLVARSWWVERVHLFLLLSLIGIVALHLTPAMNARGTWWLGPKWPWLLSLLAYTTTVGLQWLAFVKRSPNGREALVVAFQSLVPRLAGVSIVGLLLLASSAELLGFVLAGAGGARFGLLALAGSFYLWLEICRRIRPTPSIGRLVLVSLDLGATGFSHSLALTLIAERGLLTIAGRPSVPFSTMEFLNISIFLFAIGLIANLIWSDEPVTQPL